MYILNTYNFLVCSGQTMIENGWNSQVEKNKLCQENERYKATVTPISE